MDRLLPQTAEIGPQSGTSLKKRNLLRGTLLTGAVAMLSLASTRANAETWQIGNYAISLQSTLDYTFGVRTAQFDNGTTALNTDDGNRNFRNGIMENLFQTTEQLNIQNGDYGLRASAQALIDTVYLQDNKNNSPDTFNSYGIGPRGFPSGTIANEGRNFRMLAAFLYGAEDFDGGAQRLSWQLGRQTITWGEALFSADGLSGLQAPVNVYVAQSEPNPLVQSLFLPTGAGSVAYSFASGITLNGYWQFEYEPDVLPGVGSYFSPADIIGPGAQRVLATPISLGAVSIYRAPDIRPNNGLDQFGFAAHDGFANYQFGAYFVRGIPKTPNVYTYPYAPTGDHPTATGFSVGQYNLAYAQPVNAFGTSVSTTFGSANIAAEITARTNQPLVSQPFYFTAADGNYQNPLYATGNVLDGEFNGIDVTPPLPLMPNGAAVAAELTINDVLGVSKRKSALVTGNTREGGSFELTFSPNWYPVSELEIELPIGWTTAFLGDSEYDSSETAGASTYDIGLEGVYDNNLSFGINYQRYAGPPNRQTYLDRDFATFYVSKTF